MTRRFCGIFRLGRRSLEAGGAELIVAAHNGVGKAIRLEVNVQYRLRCKAAIAAAQHFERGAVTYDCKLIANPLHTISDGGPRQLRGQKEGCDECRVRPSGSQREQREEACLLGPISPRPRNFNRGKVPVPGCCTGHQQDVIDTYRQWSLSEG